VVDTVDAGQKCIEYLRTHNVGRASFFVLEKLPQKAPPPIQTPEGVPRLYDLIKPKDPRFCSAFYKALSDTLVANDLEQANRIAFGARRYRVVTLSGELIDTSGTMSGGGSRPQKGGMSSKLAAESVPADVMRKYQQDSEQATMALENALKEVQAIESELEEHQRMLPETELLMQKTTMEIKAGTARITEAEKHVQNLKYVCLLIFFLCRSLMDYRAQNKPDTGYLARIDELNEEADKAATALDKLQTKSDTISASIKELEQKILQIGGSKLLAQKSKVDGIRLHIKLANDELTKAEVAKAKAEKDITKLATSIGSSTETIEEVEQDLAKLVSELEEANKYVRAVKKTVEQAQNKVEEAKQDMDNIKEELDEKNEQIEEYRQKEVQK
jgi:structural maintenance of chromosome 4